MGLLRNPGADPHNFPTSFSQPHNTLSIRYELAGGTPAIKAQNGDKTMKKKTLILVGGLLVALMVLVVAGATIAYAQSPTLTSPLHGRGPGDGRGPLGSAGLEAAAEALGMTTDELTSALQEGKTLEQLAEEAGVDLQDVQDAIRAARDVELRERIEQAVSDGTMTQEKADWLLEGLDKGFLDGPGFGFGFGPHGLRPDDGSFTPPVQPTQSGNG